MNYQVSFAQNYEDVYLDAFLSDVTHGYYVDVGANHPIKHSVTKRFSLKGWRGINLEPIRSLQQALVLDRPDDVSLAFGISDQPGKLMFREYEGNGLSTFSATMIDEYTSGSSIATAKYQDYEVEVRTLESVLSEHPLPKIHFMKVDIEGYEYEALVSNNWRKFRPEVLCIEANHIVKDWHKLMKQAGYIHAFFDGLNEYFVAEEARYRIELFLKSYPSVAIAPYIIKHDFHLQLLDQEHRLRSYRVKLGACEQRAGNMELQLSAARQQLNAAKGIKSQIKELALTIDRRILGKLSRWDHRVREGRRKIISAAGVATSADPKILLVNIQAADIDVFWDDARSPLLPLVGRKFYSISRRVVKGLAEMSLKILRSLRRMRRRA